MGFTCAAAATAQATRHDAPRTHAAMNVHSGDAAPAAIRRDAARSRIIDSLLAPYAKPGMPGAAVVVIHDGRVMHLAGYGLADVEHGEGVTPASDFRLASLSKQFTATAIMQLVAAHKLRYDDDVSTILHDLPAFAHGVTIRQLLHHTGGLPDYEDFVPDSQTAQVHDADIPALIAHASAPRFAAGTKYEYSNTGYVLLGLVVEQLTHQPFADYLRTRVFVPLGMTNTVALVEGHNVVPHRAYGHTVAADGSVRRTDQSNTSATLGDGGIYTSVSDLVKWDHALEKHTLVSAEAQRLAFTPGTLTSGASTGYGFGWFVDEDHGTMRVRHHGESRGFTNGIVRFPEKRLTVVVLTNRTGGAPWDIGQRIAELYLGEKGAPSPAWKPE